MEFDPEVIAEGRAIAQTFPSLAVGMASLLAKRMHDLGQLDEDTIKHLQALLRDAAESFPDPSTGGAQMLATIQGWLPPSE
jgi:hypothetical protein